MIFTLVVNIVFIKVCWLIFGVQLFPCYFPDESFTVGIDLNDVVALSWDEYAELLSVA